MKVRLFKTREEMQHVGHLFWDAKHIHIRDKGQEILDRRASLDVQSTPSLHFYCRKTSGLRSSWERIVDRYSLRDGIQARNESDWFKL